MKKLFTFIILLVALLMLTSTVAFAFSYTPAKVSVPVEIEQGGTAVIIPEVNCPIPEICELKLADGEVGRFYIDFSEPGSYTYSVQVQPDGRDITFDTTVYTVRIYVTDDNGVLKTTAVVYKGDEKYAGHTGSDGTPECLLFANILLPPEPTEPSDEGSNVTPPPDKRNPKTSDDTMMEHYFLVAMIASAGLLGLSVIYLADTNKMIKKKKNTD